jgi:RHS repeat-associated protein
VHSYKYDARNLMTDYDGPGTSNNTLYRYGDQGRRITKNVNGSKTAYVHDGLNTMAEYNGSDQLQRTYVTPGLDQNLSLTASGNTYYYLSDALGSIRQLLDADQSTQNAYDYQAFGSAYGSPTENLSQPFRFTGREWDPESNLYYYRARNYEATLGRFLNRDPRLTSGRSSYAYVWNDPVLLSDPTGRIPPLVGIFIVAGFLVLEMPENLNVPLVPEEVGWQGVHKPTANETQAIYSSLCVLLELGFTNGSEYFEMIAEWYDNPHFLIGTPPDRGLPPDEQERGYTVAGSFLVVNEHQLRHPESGDLACTLCHEWHHWRKPLPNEKLEERLVKRVVDDAFVKAAHAARNRMKKFCCKRDGGPRGRIEQRSEWQYIMCKCRILPKDDRVCNPCGRSILEVWKMTPDECGAIQVE